VINLKWGAIAAAAAMVISVGLGLLSGVNILHVFLRALIFAVVFFGVGFGLRFLINNFFPEFLPNDEETSAQGSPDQPGSRVNIIMDNTGEYAVPELYKAPGDPNELGNINDLVTGAFKPRSSFDEQQPKTGIDRMEEAGYNKGGRSFPDQDDFGFQETEFFERQQVDKPSVEKPVFTPSFGDDTGVGGLPDLEMFAMAFSGGGGESRASVPMPAAGSASLPEMPEEFEPVQPSRQSHYTAGKPMQLKGDFNPKELAKGIHTVLSKDK